MRSFHTTILGSLVVLAIVLAACGGPTNCPGLTTGAADQAKFGQHFTNMALAKQGGAAQTSDPKFAASDNLEVVTTTLADTSTRMCVQSGKPPVDKTSTLAKGESRTAVGTFGKGSHVVRVFVDGTLVKNLPFTVQ